MKKTESNEFAMRLIPSVMSILLCLGLLCTTSLAYFTDTVTSRSNVIASASYWLEVENVTPQSTAAEPSMIMEDFAGEETTAQTPAVEEEYTPEESESGVAPAAESDIPEVNAQTGITTTISTASSSKNSNALYDEESYEVVNAGISADAVSILTASLTEEEAAEDGGAGSKSINVPITTAGLYYFKITAHGTAQNGYCVISIGDKSYYTTRIAPGYSITLCIAVGAPSTDAGSTIEFTAQWGTSAYFADENPTVILYDGTEGKDTIVACTTEEYEALLKAASDETDETDETGDDETGDDEIGNDETGNDETGDDETGDDETGNDETGDDETGNDETGNDETGDDETGEDETGEDETGEDETGNDETGDDETGNDETGDDETGNDETGDDETGVTPGENQGGGDDILTVDAAA